jgi:hypothetical protein
LPTRTVRQAEYGTEESNLAIGLVTQANRRQTERAARGV